MNKTVNNKILSKKVIILYLTILFFQRRVVLIKNMYAEWKIDEAENIKEIFNQADAKVHYTELRVFLYL